MVVRRPLVLLETVLRRVLILVSLCTSIYDIVRVICSIDIGIVDVAASLHYRQSVTRYYSSILILINITRELG